MSGPGTGLLPEGRTVRADRSEVENGRYSGQRWNVAPTLLRREDSSVAAQKAAPNVIQLRKK